MPKHHWIPISLFGLDIPENVCSIPEHTHQHIHQMMDYKRNTYTNMWRSFRKKHNHKFVRDMAMVEDILRMQQGYLSRYTKLCPYASRLHMQKMNELTRYYQPNHTTQRNWSKLWQEYCEAFRQHHLSAMMAA